jgi:hypothetical protein
MSTVDTARDRTHRALGLARIPLRRLPGAALAAILLLPSMAGGGSLRAQAPDLEAAREVQATSGEPVVHVVYLVPSDRSAQPRYALSIRNAILDLQGWYQVAMGGVTFRLTDPVVQTIALPHPAAFYSSPPSDGLAFWNSVLNDGFALTGGAFFDPQNVWLYYVDADPGCNQTTGGTSGVALLPENDLRGLNGETTVPVCGGPPGDQFPITRWIGGLGHEAGHAFGLPHPPGCDQGLPACDSHALMWLGFYDYPNTYLTQEEIQQLRQSPFFLPGRCSPNGTTLCLSSGRFEASATWAIPDGRVGVAQAVSLTLDTGYFWFFDAANVEAVVKVLDGCGLDQAYWFFAGGLTNVNAEFRVRDTRTGRTKIYSNPQSTPFQPIQDTRAFATCGAAAAPAASSSAARSDPPQLPASLDSLIPGRSVLLNDDRFRIDVTWQTKDGHSGTGTPVQLTRDTAYFWFFDSGNVEMVVKVLNACAFGNYWVFAGGLTNVDVVMTVTDTRTGRSNRYTNPQGTPFRPLQDTAAFPTCP